MKTKKKTVTAKELLSLRNCINPNDFFVLADRSFNINGIEGNFSSADGERITAYLKGYAAHNHWHLNDQTDYLFLLYMLSLMERTKESCYSKEKEAEDRLDKYFRTYKKVRKDTHKVRKTRSDKGKKRGKYLKKVEEPVEYTFNIRTPQLQVDPLPPLPPSGSVFELLEKILSVLQEITSKV